MAKIVITDTDFEDNDIEVAMAHEVGVEIALFNDRSPEAIIKNAHDADGIVTSYGVPIGRGQRELHTGCLLLKFSRHCLSLKW